MNSMLGVGHELHIFSVEYTRVNCEGDGMTAKT